MCTGCAHHEVSAALVARAAVDAARLLPLRARGECSAQKIR
jgi:hypothetical protein